MPEGTGAVAEEPGGGRHGAARCHICPVLPAGPTATARSTSTTATNASTAA